MILKYISIFLFTFGSAISHSIRSGVMDILIIYKSVLRVANVTLAQSGQGNGQRGDVNTSGARQQLSTSRGPGAPGSQSCSGAEWGPE